MKNFVLSNGSEKIRFGNFIINNDQIFNKILGVSILEFYLEKEYHNKIIEPFQLVLIIIEGKNISMKVLKRCEDFSEVVYGEN